MTRAVRAAVALLATIGVAAGCGPSPAPDEQATQAPSATAAGEISLNAEAMKAAGITVAPAATATRTDRIEAPGVIALDETRTARIGAMVEGIVVSTAADVGKRVGRGEVLATLMSERVHEAWADYRKALAERRRLTNELAYADQAEARAKRLFDDKALAEQEVQRASANRVAAREQLDIAATEVRRAEEALEHLGITNKEDPTGESGEEIPARAPLTGVVLERLVTAGTAVTPGTPLFVVSDLSHLWALAEIDETRLSRVAVGRPVDVRVSAFPDVAFQGTIAFVGDTVNPRTRRVTVRCILPNPDGRLKPEMFATIALGTTEPRLVVVVPATAIQEYEGSPVVFVQDAPQTFRVRKVVTGPETEGLVEVRQGLKAGETIAATGAFLLKSELLKASAPDEG